MRTSRVLFVDPTDGPRAQLARALLAAEIGSGEPVHSAGTHPGGSLEGVRAVLAEVGVPYQEEQTSLTAVARHPPELLIAVCEEGCDSCPYVPGAGAGRRWPFEDPELVSGTARLTALRAIRDGLLPRVRELAEELAR